MAILFKATSGAFFFFEDGKKKKQISWVLENFPKLTGKSQVLGYEMDMQAPVESLSEFTQSFWVPARIL